MIEKVVYDYLNECKIAPVKTELPESVPNPGSSAFIVVEKTGGGKVNHIHTATIAVQSYAPTLYEAADLNEDVKQAMFDIVSLNEISRSSLNSDYNFTDPSTKQYRYQAVFELTYYEGA